MNESFEDDDYAGSIAEAEYHERTREIEIAQRQFEMAELEGDTGKGSLWACRVIALCLGRDDGYPVPSRPIPDWAAERMATIAEGVYDLGRLRDPLTRPDRATYNSDEAYRIARADWAANEVPPAQTNETVLKLFGFNRRKGKNVFVNFRQQMENLRAASLNWCFPQKAGSIPSRAIKDYMQRHSTAAAAAKIAIEKGKDIDRELAILPISDENIDVP